MWRQARDHMDKMIRKAALALARVTLVAANGSACAVQYSVAVVDTWADQAILLTVALGLA